MSAPKARCHGCLQPKAECEGGPECLDDEGGPLVSLNPPPPVPYDGPVHDADG